MPHTHVNNIGHTQTLTKDFKSSQAAKWNKVLNTEQEFTAVSWLKTDIIHQQLRWNSNHMKCYQKTLAEIKL